MIPLRWTKIENKEIIHVKTGERIGFIAEADLIINLENGEIESLIVPQRSGLFDIFRSGGDRTIPWSAIKTVGPQVLLVDMENTRGTE